MPTWFAIFLSGGLLVWTVAAVLTLEVLPAINKWLKEPGNSLRTALWVAAIAAVAATTFALEDSWLAGLRSEAISIAITVILIDELQRHRAWQERKREIIEQMGSPIHDAAGEAVRFARNMGILTDGSLRGAALMFADLVEAPLWKANLEGAHLSQANLEGAFLLYANLKGANLFYANLQGANLGYANLQGADLWCANLQGANLFNANLQGANLEHAKLEGTHLRLANLDEVKRWLEDRAVVYLSLANLEWAEYDEKNIWEPATYDEHTRWVRATYDKHTIWPDDDFDPIAAGCVLVEE